ncbi:MAG TPA: FAD:protein FMN transferase [Stellaceae bacterium]|nr:FAD:protein FMN transferase [Stellaceae bacterium]
MMSASNNLKRARPLLGTFVEIEAPAHAAIDAGFAAVDKVHRLMSVHDAASEVSLLNREAAMRWVEVHPWTFEVLSVACDLYQRSSGVFDVTVAQGRGGAIWLRDGAVRFDMPLKVDLGGIAKGFAVDRAIAALVEAGASHGLVNAGGDLRVFGEEAVTVHLRDPRREGGILGCVSVHDQALASSAFPHPLPLCGRGGDPSRSDGGVREAAARWEGWGAPSHPHSALSRKRERVPSFARQARVIGASVIAPTCILADALTKIVGACGEAALPLLTRTLARALFITETGELHRAA